jgi:hypothetical protein
MLINVIMFHIFCKMLCNTCKVTLNLGSHLRKYCFPTDLPPHPSYQGHHHNIPLLGPRWLQCNKIVHKCSEMPKNAMRYILNVTYYHFSQTIIKYLYIYIQFVHPVMHRNVIKCGNWLQIFRPTSAIKWHHDNFQLLWL